MAQTFEFFRFRFHFRAAGAVHFPAGKAGNVVRGALGLALGKAAPGPEGTPEGTPDGTPDGTPEGNPESVPVYARLFAPEGGPGRTPSGLADPPRPFVLRAAHLNGHTISPGSRFFWDVHAFDVRNPPLAPLRQAWEKLAEEGLGPRRGRAFLEWVEQLDLEDRGQPVVEAPLPPLSIDLDSPAGAPAVTTAKLRFLTPTELKSGGGLAERPEFAILFGRLRDRLGALRALYGRGPLEVDFRGLGDRSRTIRLTACALAWQRIERKSTRTGQVHPLGGFTGEADYTGDLTEFLPWLAAARWVGVGRQTVWGNGDVRVVQGL